MLPPPASPPTEEKRRSRAEKFGEISPQLDDVVSLSYHSGGSDSGEGAHRKPVPGAATADSWLSLERTLTNADESLRKRRANALFFAGKEAVGRLCSQKAPVQELDAADTSIKLLAERYFIKSTTNNSKPAGQASHKQPPEAVEKELAANIVQHQIGSLPPIWDAINPVHTIVTDCNIIAFDSICAVTAAILSTLSEPEALKEKISKETGLKLAAACQTNRLEYPRRYDYNEKSKRYADNKRQRHY